MSRIRIVATIVGGNFGGKNEITTEPVVALLAKKTGTPGEVHLHAPRGVHLVDHAAPAHHGLQDGVTKQGKILARQIRLVLDGGAYCSWSETTLGKACILSAGPYKIDNLHAEAFVVYTNKTMTGAMRGFGAPQVCFAYESHMDDMAKALGIDPLEMRLITSLEEGLAQPDEPEAAQRRRQGVAAAGGGAFRLERERSAGHERRGRGIACMWYPIGFTVAANPSAAVVKVNEDGTATLLTGTVETGQGSLTVLAQIVAQELGIATDDVHVVSADTDTTPMDTGAIASRTTYVTGNAARLAAEKAKDILFEVAAPLLGVKPQPARGRATTRSRSRDSHSAASTSVTWRSARAGVNGQPPIGSASFNPATVALDPETGQGKPFATYVYATQIAEVDVDDETGEVEVLRIVGVARLRHADQPDAGRRPGRGRYFDGRGVCAGGRDALRPADGRQINPNLTNYIMPTSLDMPKIEVDIVDSYDPTGPFGAKGVGEPTCVSTAAAILNAIHDAVGVRITRCPPLRRRVYAAIKAKRAQEAKLITAGSA